MLREGGLVETASLTAAPTKVEGRHLDVDNKAVCQSSLPRPSDKVQCQQESASLAIRVD
jgi:hypothetical protein